MAKKHLNDAVLLVHEIIHVLDKQRESSEDPHLCLI